VNSMEKIQKQINLFKDVFAKEGISVIWSFLYFFSLLTSYFILRPIRDAMGIASGVKELPWLFTATFFVMLIVMPIYGALVSRYPRRKFIPYVYLFFILNLLAFWYCLSNNLALSIVQQVFFVWLSVFNVFVVSVFWSFMVDIYKAEHSKVLFGFIASGGTIGGICGPAIVTFLTSEIGTESLFIISMIMLSFAVFCVLKLSDLHPNENSEQDHLQEKQSNGLGGGMFSGLIEVLKSRYLINISLLVFLLSLTATFAYFQQGDLISSTYSERDDRVQVFGQIDFYVSIFALVFQLALVGPLMSTYGVKSAIILLPIVTVIGFLLLSISPTIGVLILFQIARRASEYGTFVPARENLFSIVTREQKYKSKNFIDTVVLRGGDVANGWLYNSLSSVIGMSISAIALVGLPIAILWGGIAWQLGKTHSKETAG
jgi:ATP:ADP antiporter, AAA family